MPNARPATQAFLVCDRIITEEKTHKNTLVGVFTTAWADSFPATHPGPALYYRGTVDAGEHRFRIDFARRGSEEMLAKVEGTLAVKRTEMPTEISIQLPFLVIPQPGEYEFRMWIDESYVQRVGFHAEQRQQPEGEEHDSYS